MDIPPNLYCNFADPEAEIKKLEEVGRLNLQAYYDSDTHVDTFTSGVAAPALCITVHNRGA